MFCFIKQFALFYLLCFSPILSLYFVFILFSFGLFDSVFDLFCSVILCFCVIYFIHSCFCIYLSGPVSEAVTWTTQTFSKDPQRRVEFDDPDDEAKRLLRGGDSAIYILHAKKEDQGIYRCKEDDM